MSAPRIVLIRPDFWDMIEVLLIHYTESVQDLVLERLDHAHDERLPFRIVHFRMQAKSHCHIVAGCRAMKSGVGKWLRISHRGSEARRWNVDRHREPRQSLDAMLRASAPL